MKNGTSMAKRMGLALLAVLFAVCLSLGLYYTAPKTVQAEETPAAVFVLGAREGDESGAEYYEDKALGWSAAVSAAQELDGALVKVVLANDWTAAQNATDVTSFGTGAGFENGSIVVEGNANIEFDLNGHVLDRALTNTINENGHIFVVKGGKLAITDGNHDNEHFAGVNPGPLYTYREEGNEEPVAITGGILTGAYGKNGGAIAVEGGELSVTGATFFKNKAQNGGAVCAAANANFTNTLFAENAASQSGGAIYATVAGNITGASFIHNTAGENGGAACLLGEGFNFIRETQFTQNEADYAGGAIFTRNHSHEVSLLQCEISKNTAGTYGGGVYVDSGSVNVTDTTISENEAGTSGGGIAVNVFVNDVRALIRLKNSTVANNNAAVSGGGISLRDFVLLYLLGVTIQGNETDGQGGGIYAYSASSQKIVDIFTDDGYGVTEIKGNKASAGGGMYLHSNTVLNCGHGSTAEIINNQATQDGGGLFLTGSGSNVARIIVSGKLVVNNNVKGTDTASNLCFGNAACVLEGRFSASFSGELSPQIGLSPAEGQTVLTEGYKKNNISLYAFDPARCFFADDGKKILLGANGEVTTGDTAAVWKVNGEAVPDYGTYIVYGGSVTSVTLNDGVNLLSALITDALYDNGKLAPYKLFTRLGDLDLAFEVWVLPGQIMGNNVSFTQNITSLAYNGMAQEPEVKVTVGGKTLAEGTDFTVAYSNNKNSGTATALVTGTGNYKGEAMLTFEISKLTNSYLSPVWEYFIDGEWTASDTIPAFCYNGENQGSLIRAKLVIDGIADTADYVYAQGFVPEDKTNWNDNMWISFSGMFGGTIVTEFKNATAYTATITGMEGANASFSVGYNFTKDFTIGKQQLGISADTFTAEDAYRDEEGNKLWLVNYNGSAQGLLDGDGLEYVDNGTVRQGLKSEVDLYARYRGGELALTLNENYLVNGVRLAEYLQSANSVVYEHNTATGSLGAVIPLTSTVRITLSDNYSTQTGSNTLTITKSWKLVTINNMFTTMGDTEVPAPANWTYGSQVGIQALKPQQGNTVVYSFYKIASGESESAGAFAVVFDAQGNAGYYAAKDEFTADLTRPIRVETENYFDYFAERLGEGNYRMVARVPRGAGGSDVVPIMREFTFAVSAFRMNTEQGGFRSELSYALNNTSVPYSGSANNVPEFVLYFNDRELERGVDYELTSADVNVGPASITVTGMNGLTGEVTLNGVYEITRAVNGWTKIPSIMYWAYRSFDKEINRLSAEARLLDDSADMWFMVTTDEAGQIPLEGLEKFRLEDGLVNDEVAQKLSALAVGSYYLFARVEGNDNYTALDPAGIEFRVFPAENYWDITPSVATWITGSYEEDDNEITAKAHFGKTKIVVTDEAGNEVYNSETGVNLFAGAGVGTYLITATVEETANYSGLSYTATFRVFAKAGLPWWVTLVVVIAVLLVVGIVLYVLNKKGILQMLSGKMVVAIRAKASADATIAAVKANKKAEEAKAALALAEARERIEALRLANEEAKKRPVEEQAAALEERAQEAAKNAERMQKKAARMQKQAASMKAQAAIGAEADIGAPASQDNAENEAAATDDSDEYYY